MLHNFLKHSQAVKAFDDVRLAATSGVITQKLVVDEASNTASPTLKNLKQIALHMCITTTFSHCYCSLRRKFSQKLGCKSAGKKHLN